VFCPEGARNARRSGLKVPGRLSPYLLAPTGLIRVGRTTQGKPWATLFRPLRAKEFSGVTLYGRFTRKAPDQTELRPGSPNRARSRLLPDECRTAEFLGVTLDSKVTREARLRRSFALLPSRRSFAYLTFSWLAVSYAWSWQNLRVVFRTSTRPSASTRL
jgi:hypothetical protein